MLKTLTVIARMTLTVWLLVEVWHGRWWALALVVTLQSFAIEMLAAIIDLTRRGR